MVEDIERTRRQRLQQHLGGFWSCWYYYNRATLAVLLPVIAALCWQVQTERQHAQLLRADNVVLANPPQLACYAAERSTSVIIAGSSQKLVDEALRYAGYRIDQIRGEWIAAKDRTKRQ